MMGRVFESLALRDHSESAFEIAQAVWRIAWEGDWTHDQMGCDDALRTLGLAKSGVHPDWPDEEPGTLYAEEDGVTFREVKR